MSPYGLNREMALESFCITYHNHTSESNSNLGPFLPRKTLMSLLEVVFYCAGGAGGPTAM